MAGQMRVRSTIFGVIAALVIVAGASFIPFEAQAQGIILMEVEPTSKVCHAGEAVTYQWFVFNDYDVPYILEVSADNESGSRWTSSFNQKVFVLLGQGSAFINLTVSADDNVKSMTVIQAITFRFINLTDDAPPSQRTSTVTTEMVTIWGAIAPGKNKLLGRFDNPFPEPLDGNYATFFLNILIWAGIALFVAYVVDPAVRMFTKRTKTDIDDRILKILRKPLALLIVIFGFVTSISILPLGEGDVRLIFQVYGVVLISVLTFVVYKIFKEVLILLGKRLSAKTESEVDDVLVPVVDKIGGVIILLFGAIAMINYLGYDITFILAGVGVFGLVIAFAAQDVLSNFFSGIFLLLDRPFVEGDFITISTGEMCRVEKIGMRSTRLYEVFENDYIVLPNNKLVNDKITNLDEPDEQGKSRVEVSVAYGSDVEKVERVLLDEASKHPNVVQETGKAPIVRFQKFGESSLEFALIVWVDNFMNKWRVAHDLRKQIHMRFAQEGIEIPFPQRTIYVKEMPKQGK